MVSSQCTGMAEYCSGGQVSYDAVTLTVKAEIGSDVVSITTDPGFFVSVSVSSVAILQKVFLSVGAFAVSAAESILVAENAIVRFAHLCIVAVLPAVRRKICRIIAPVKELCDWIRYRRFSTNNLFFRL